MPGIRVMTAARILFEAGDTSAFPLPLVTRHLRRPHISHPTIWVLDPGASTHPRAGHQHLRRVFFISGFAALHDPTSRAH
jgi:hypothetical protein